MVSPGFESTHILVQPKLDLDAETTLPFGKNLIIQSKFFCGFEDLHTLKGNICPTA